jgi:hypothetical protein
VRVKAELGDAVEGGDEHKAISWGKEEIEVKEEQEMKKIREKISKIYKKT